jgi:hypothetical protein
VLSPPILYNGSQGEETAMNGRLAGRWGRWLAGALAVVAAVAVLAATFRVHTQTYTSYPAGPAGSVTYRQEMAFVQCLRRHGVPGLPAIPPPGGSLTLQVPQNGTGGKPGDRTAKAVDACQRLAPRGREITNVQVVL